MVPLAKTIISSPVLRVNKSNSDINNKKFVTLLNSTVWHCIHHENIDELHLNEYGLHKNRTGSINLGKGRFPACLLFCNFLSISMPITSWIVSK